MSEADRPSAVDCTDGRNPNMKDDRQLPSRVSLSILLLASAWPLGVLPSGSATGSTKQKSAPAFNIIALAEANSIHRPFVNAAKTWLQKQAAGNAFSIEYIENTDKIDDAFLSRFQVFIQLDYPPYGWAPQAVAALLFALNSPGIAAR